MKNINLKSFVNKGWFLTALLILEELFLIVAAVFFSKKVDEIFLIQRILLLYAVL